MILTIEDLMYQLGGQLPSIVQDSVTSGQLAQMQGQVIPFTQKAQDLGPSEFYTYLDRQRVIDNQRNNQKTSEAATKRAEISNSLRTLSAIQKDLDTNAKSVTGLPLYFKEAQKIDGEIKKEMTALQDDIANAQISLSTGKDVAPEVFDRIVQRKGKIQNIMSSPQYGTLAAFAPTIKKQIEEIAKYNNNPDYIVDDEKYNQWVLKINEAVDKGEDIDISQLQIPANTVVDKKALDKAVNTVIDNYVKDSSSLETMLTPTDYHKVFQKSKVKITDLSDVDQATEFMLGYIKSNPGGETYIQELGGDEGFKRVIDFKLKASGRNPGGVDRQTVDSGTFTRPDSQQESAQKTATNAEIRNQNRVPSAAEKSIADMQAIYGDMGLRVTKPNEAIKSNTVGGYDGNKLIEFTPQVPRGALDETIKEAIVNYGIIDVETGKEITVPEYKKRVANRYNPSSTNTVQPKAPGASSGGVNDASVKSNSAAAKSAELRKRAEENRKNLNKTGN